MIGRLLDVRRNGDFVLIYLCPICESLGRTMVPPEQWIVPSVQSHGNCDSPSTRNRTWVSEQIEIRTTHHRQEAAYAGILQFNAA
jgi:hypothetical protein